MTIRDSIRRLTADLPTGSSLPPEAWQHRHRVLLAILAIHVPALLLFGILRGFPVAVTVLGLTPVLLLLATAAAPGASRTARAVALVLGLLSCSALLVLFWGGTTEAHFHYFVVVGIVALYEAWTPYAIAFAFVVLQHGIGSAIFPSAVYEHSHHSGSPWAWSLTHGLFVAALGVANVVSWKANEQLREDRAAAERRLRHQAGHDPLTGLVNRAEFGERLTALLGEDRTAALIFADLDDFKVVNDSLGHEAGDEVLVESARRLRSALRPGDVLGRFGGDEFVIALADVADRSSAEEIATRLAAALAEPYAIRGMRRQITASFGIAAVDDVREVGPLVRDADLAMYRAKELGKDRAVVFDGAMRDRAMKRMELEAGMRHALVAGEFELHYQPQLRFADGTVAGVEALVRWRHPEHGLISPAEFIPIAEQSGLIGAIGAWVLREACEQMAAWNAERGPGAPALTMAVNVSARQLGDTLLPQFVAETLDATGLDPSQLCLELTESAIISDLAVGLGVMAELKAVGVRLAIDDFGVGQSSLGMLRQFAQADELKIDKSFVDDVEAPEQRSIVAAIVSLAGTLGFTVVAEGVERAEQAAVLRDLGCHIAQGFHFARPQPADLVRERHLARADAPSPRPVA